MQVMFAQVGSLADNTGRFALMDVWAGLQADDGGLAMRCKRLLTIAEDLR